MLATSFVFGSSSLLLGIENSSLRSSSKQSALGDAGHMPDGMNLGMLETHDAVSYFRSPDCDSLPANSHKASPGLRLVSTISDRYLK